jgi:hypothetical protein
MFGAAANREFYFTAAAERVRVAGSPLGALEGLSHWGCGEHPCGKLCQRCMAVLLDEAVGGVLLPGRDPHAGAQPVPAPAPAPAAAPVSPPSPSWPKAAGPTAAACAAAEAAVVAAAAVAAAAEAPAPVQALAGGAFDNGDWRPAAAEALQASGAYEQEGSEEAVFGDEGWQQDWADDGAVEYEGGYDDGGCDLAYDYCGDFDYDGGWEFDSVGGGDWCEY